MKKNINQLQQETYNELLGNYLHYLTALGYSERSIKRKGSEVREFLHYLEQQGITDISGVSTLGIKNYQDYLKERPCLHREGILSLGTIYTHMHSIRQLFLMLQEGKHIGLNPMSTLKFSYPKQKPPGRNILSMEEIKSLYRVTESMQERAMLSLSYGCGLRSMELEAVNMDDVKIHDGLLVVPSGKGNKRRVIPMSKKVVEDIKKYCQHERALYVKSEEEKAVLLNTRGDRLRKHSLRKMLRQLIERSGSEQIINKKICIHHLRHSIATHLLEQGLALEQVRDFLGHTHLETTEIYTRVNHQQLKSLIQ